MTYRDTLVTCQECGKTFVFTVEVQRRLAEQGGEPSVPELCEACTRRIKYGGRLHGRIKWFNLEKGFGFIAQDDGPELFVHRAGVPLTDQGALPGLPDGLEVLYDVMDTPKGPQAVKVTPYNEP